MERVRVIAELCTNHGGDLTVARRMIDKAREAGCWGVKVQYYRTEDLYPPNHQFHDWVKKAELSVDGISVLKAYAKKQRLQFLCTCFKQPKLVDDLEKINLQYYKVREADSQNMELMDRVLDTGKNVFVSTVKLPIEPYLLYNPRIIWMLATPFYPCPIENVELNRVPAFRGLSDHTRGTLIALAASAIWLFHIYEGSFFIEKHAYLEGTNPLEKEWSISFSEMADLIKQVRELEKAKFAPKYL